MHDEVYDITYGNPTLIRQDSVVGYVYLITLLCLIQLGWGGHYTKYDV